MAERSDFPAGGDALSASLGEALPPMTWDELLTPQRRRERRPPAAGEAENAFEKDYQRIVSSASFRRLQDKTQVFPLDQSDFVRTRLTHSLEVSSLAKSLGKLVAQELYFLGKARELGPLRVQELCDVLLCAGLIHDIGNPPFGHYGETTIRDWFARHMERLEFYGKTLAEALGPQRRADFLRFEGNAQALRLLDKLHFLVDDSGMNLSLSLLGIIVKYPFASTEHAGADAGRTGKIGYFQAEEALFADIAAATGTRGRSHPLSLVLEAADDIAYRTADVEDAYQKGRFSFGQLQDALAENRRVKAAEAPIAALYREKLGELAALRERAKREGIHKPEQYAVQNFLVRLRNHMLRDCAERFGQRYEAIMLGGDDRPLAAGTFSGLMLDVLGDVAYDFVFSSKRIVQMEIAANTIIGGLLDKFVPACLYWDTGEHLSSLEPRLMSIISDNYRACYHRHAEGQDAETRLYLRLLLVTDYICGMTDHFAKRLYQQLNGIG